MARSTCNIFNPQVSGAGADGDTIVAGPDSRVEDGDIGGELDVDAVGVGAVSGSHDLHSMYFDVVASTDDHVEYLTINRRQPGDDNVVGISDSKCLLAHTQKEKIIIKS